MVKINWEDFKEYKKGHGKKDDNFLVLLDFIKSYYNLASVVEIYNSLKNDELANMMLEKRDIKDVVTLEKYLYKQHS